VLFPIFIFPLFFKLPAVVYIGFWFFLQFFTGVTSLASSPEAFGGIAWWAHVGGFIAGAALCRPFALPFHRGRQVSPGEYASVSQHAGTDERRED